MNSVGFSRVLRIMVYSKTDVTKNLEEKIQGVWEEAVF